MSKINFAEEQLFMAALTKMFNKWRLHFSYIGCVTIV